MFTGTNTRLTTVGSGVPQSSDAANARLPGGTEETTNDRRPTDGETRESDSRNETMDADEHGSRFGSGGITMAPPREHTPLRARGYEPPGRENREPAEHDDEGQVHP
jgi:hypothetical protein